MRLPTGRMWVSKSPVGWTRTRAAQVKERLTSQIAATLDRVLRPWAGCVIADKHLMDHAGVQKQLGGVTSAMSALP